MMKLAKMAVPLVLFPMSSSADTTRVFLSGGGSGVQDL
jgi:hypothetical protein